MTLPTPRRDFSLVFPPDPAWVRPTREAVRTLLAAVSRDDLVDEAVLLTSETVTNAVRACLDTGVRESVRMYGAYEGDGGAGGTFTRRERRRGRRRERRISGLKGANGTRGTPHGHELFKSPGPRTTLSAPRGSPPAVAPATPIGGRAHDSWEQESACHCT
jgi:hypothetical protein